MQQKRRDLKIIFCGDALWSQSGYGNELDWLMRRFLADGWQVAQAAKAGLLGHWIDYRLDEGVLRMYPSINHPHGSDIMFHGAKHFGAHVAISMIDVWVIENEHLNALSQIGCKWIPYMPVDSMPPSPAILRPLPFAHKILTFSKFGQQELIKSGFVSDMIYEGIDVNQLKPKDKYEARKKLGIPAEGFIWGMIAANKENPPRKSFQEALEAFKMFATAHDDARLFIHTQQISPGNFPIREYAGYLGILDKIYFLDQLHATIFATREDIETQFNAMDALLHPSQTEGFGLTIIEAQACGKPVVIHNVHSMPELIIEGKTGEKAQTASRRWTSMLNFWEVPQPTSVWYAMEKVYRRVLEAPQEVIANCRQNVVENFNIDKIFREKWVPLIEQLQDELIPEGR